MKDKELRRALIKAKVIEEVHHAGFNQYCTGNALGEKVDAIAEYIGIFFVNTNEIKSKLVAMPSKNQIKPIKETNGYISRACAYHKKGNGCVWFADKKCLSESCEPMINSLTSGLS